MTPQMALAKRPGGTDDRDGSRQARAGGGSLSDKKEPDRPVVHAETAVYEVKVWGKEGDEIDDVIEAFGKICNRVMADAKEADEWDDNGGYGTA